METMAVAPELRGKLTTITTMITWRSGVATNSAARMGDSVSPRRRKAAYAATANSASPVLTATKVHSQLGLSHNTNGGWRSSPFFFTVADKRTHIGNK